MVVKFPFLHFDGHDDDDDNAIMVAQSENKWRLFFACACFRWPFFLSVFFPIRMRKCDDYDDETTASDDANGALKRTKTRPYSI